MALNELLAPYTFLMTVATFGLIYSILTIGLNIHFGYTGLIDFGYVAFFAAGAYAATLLTVPPSSESGMFQNYLIGLALPMPWAFPLSLVVGALAGGLLALLIGLTSVRLDTHYLALATFALASVVEQFIKNESWLTASPDGFKNVPQPGLDALGGNEWQLLYLGIVALATLGVYLLAQQMLESPFGRLLKGIREDETAAQVVGKNTTRIKLESFAIGGAVAGFAGALYVHYLGVTVPEQFLPGVTFTVWIGMIIGGTASNRGAVVGGFLTIAAIEMTRFLPPIPSNPQLIPSLRWIVIGVVFILFIRYRPQGLFGRAEELEVFEE